MAGSPAPARDPIWIEDEVWQEAFETRVPSRRRRSASDRRPAGPRQAPPRQTTPRQASSPRLEPDPLEPEALEPQPLATVTQFPAPQAVEVRAPAEGRRTVTIKGRGAERNLPWPGDASARRPTRPRHERAGFRPDRLAMWAVFLGLLLVFVAAVSAH